MTSQIKILIADRCRFQECVAVNPTYHGDRTFVSCVLELADKHGKSFTELRLFKGKEELTMEFVCVNLTSERQVSGVIHWNEYGERWGIHT